MTGRILVVDDEPQIRRALCHLLSASGYECDDVGSASEAVEALRANPYDLMLCDIHMPGRSGLDLARQVLAEHADVAVVMITAVNDPDVAESALELGAYGYLIKPVSRAETRITVSNALRRRTLELSNRKHRAQLERAVADRTRDLTLSREETIQRLAIAAEYRDDETAKHNQRMSHYCRLIAERMGMSPERCEEIRLASVMHDVGKIGVSDLILHKPGKLTDEEFTQIQTHTEIGYRILSGSSSSLIELGATVAYTHHEKIDGTGYPRGLVGAEIPIEGRIAAVADVFDALTSDRIYRAAWSPERTVDFLLSERGRHFEPEIVGIFVASMDDVLRIRQRHADGP